jgi:hypothetical protein
MLSRGGMLLIGDDIWVAAGGNVMKVRLGHAKYQNHGGGVKSKMIFQGLFQKLHLRCERGSQ